MPSVQFRSAAEALQAFENTDCDAWSLWQGKQFMFKGIGIDDLRAFIDLIEQSEVSNAVYTVAYYDDITDKKQINNKTPFDGSFNFVIRSNGEEILKFRGNKLLIGNDLQSKVGALENKLDKVLESLEAGADDGAAENKLGIVGDILGHPQIGPMVQQLLMKFISSPAAAVQPVPDYQPVKLARVAGLGNAIDNDPVLENALSRLLAIDDKLPQRLAKLAALAEQDRNTYNYIVSMLDQMNLA